MTPACVADYRELARRRTPNILFSYLEAGSYAQSTLRRNMSDLQEVRLRQRVMRDVSKVSLETELFGEKLAMPVVLAPVGMGGMYASRGETKAARAAQGAGVPFCLSTLSICGVEEAAAAIQRPIWFQLYMTKDRGFMETVLARAAATGCRVLVFTVDLPVPGARYSDVRTRLTGDLSLRTSLSRAWDGITHPHWSADLFLQGRPHTFGNVASAIPKSKSNKDYWAWVRQNFDASVTWSDLAWVRERWPGPIVIKGVLDVEDAREAARAGADGLIVSNHGGRQLDSASSTIAALPAIVEAVGDQLTVMMDGGIRSGLDVLKALSLGAKSVMIGRAWAYGLAARGEAGVSDVLRMLRQELATALALTGCTDVRDAGPHLLGR